MRAPKLCLVPVAVTLFVAGMALAPAADAGETAKIGGSGGTTTVSMDCGSGFIVGANADGNQDGPLGMTLVRKLSFKCRQFPGGEGASATTTTRVATASSSGIGQVSSNSQSCGNNSAIRSLDLNAEMFIDRLNFFTCLSRANVESARVMNVGGFGGTRRFMACPTGEALFKVVARTGGAIDSLKGYCRSFR